eukprot:gene13293-17810_t
MMKLLELITIKIILALFYSPEVLCILSSCGVPLALDIHGYVDVRETIYNCSRWSSSPQSAPSFATAADGPTNISAQFIINNLLEINDILQTVTFDCKFRLQWTDNRFNITNLFSNVNSYVATNGIEISQYFYDQNVPLNIWRPDIHFIDEADMFLIQESLRLKDKGVIYWSRHIRLTLIQAGFEYSKYPLDTQKVQIRFESYSLEHNLLMINFVDPPIDLYRIGYNVNDTGLANIMKNKGWIWNGYTANVELHDYYRFGKTDVKKLISTGVVNLLFQRESQGVILRLGVPVMLVACITGFFFWARKESRLDATLSLLLTISALYITIFSSIPLIGQSTNMDQFVFLSFLFMLFCLCYHISDDLAVDSPKPEDKEFSTTDANGQRVPENINNVDKNGNIVLKHHKHRRIHAMLNIFRTTHTGILQAIIPAFPIFVLIFVFAINSSQRLVFFLSIGIFGIIFITLIYLFTLYYFPRIGKDIKTIFAKPRLNPFHSVSLDHDSLYLSKSDEKEGELGYGYSKEIM